MAEFLTYELLTPDTADPVIMRITGQRERGFPKLICDNGIAIISKSNPEYDAPFLFVWGEDEADDADLVYIPLADWPAVKQAIGELNESKKEKDMKEDRYEFDLREWQYDTEPEPFELPEPTKLIVTRKKPKVKTAEDRIAELEDKVRALENRANEVKG